MNDSAMRVNIYSYLACGLMAGFVFAVGLQASAGEVQKEGRKNVLLIAVDDLNDWIGPLKGHPQVKTPNFDRLAAMGVTFQNAHCQSPLCNPSRTSLLTGLRPTTTGVYGLLPWFRDVPELAAYKTLPQYFREKGYQTLTVGKVFHGSRWKEKGNPDWDVRGPSLSGAPYPKQKLVETPNSMKAVDWGTFPHKDEEKGDYQIASWVAERLADMPQEKPFFLAAGFLLPHVPCFATQKWMDLYPEETLKLPETLANDRADTPRASWWLHWTLPEPRLKWLKEKNQWKNHVRSYLACVSFMDAQLGRVLDALEQSPYAKNTVIVLFSDNGYHLGEKEISGKNTLWDPSTRVPLMFAGPGVSQGAVCTAPVELLDVFPTLCELLKLPLLKQLEGHSLVPQLKEASASREWPALTHHNRGNTTVRDARWRYIRYVDGSEELYNMEKDPEEYTNLAGDPVYADEITRLKKWIPLHQKPLAPGSRDRILDYCDGQPVWEGKPIRPDEPIPEM